MEILHGANRKEYPIMLQRRIPGWRLGAFLLFHRGEVLMHFGHQTDPGKASFGGAWCAREGGTLVMLSQCVSLLRAMK